MAANMEQLGDYIITDTFHGDGMQGIVVKAVHLPTKRIYAAKVTKFKNEDQIERFMNEVTILSKLSRSKNIVRMVDNFKTEKKGIIILEKMHWDLMTCLEQNLITQKQRMQIFEQVCKAVKSMHSRGVAHLDLKPENILLSQDFKRVKLCDFGASQVLPKSGLISNNGGTIIYSSPENFTGARFDGKKSDIWSLGILYHVLITTNFPFSDGNERFIIDCIRKRKLKIHPTMKEYQTNIMNRMVETDPSARITIEQLLALVQTDSSWLHGFTARVRGKLF